MHPNAELLTRFYDCLQRRDLAGLDECYHPDVEFVSGLYELRGEQVQAMWQMLCERELALYLDFSRVEADDQYGLVDLTVSYTSVEAERRVSSAVEAIFAFQDGRIVRHHDHFDVWRWAAQALGMRGRLLGWAEPLRRRARVQAQRNLDEWMAERRPEATQALS